jgi:hypothetical protein
MTTTSLFLAIGAALCGCASTSQTPIGDTTVGSYSLHIFREGPVCAAGVMTTLVIKATAGGKPSSVVGWVGAEDASQGMVTGVYDANDGDFDLDLTCPDPLPTDAKFFFTLDGTDTGSIALK